VERRNQLMPEQLVQLVDSAGNTVGRMEKLAAHQNGGTLHRAVSVLALNEAGEMLLQKRAATKYHFSGLWANACCTHPLGEETPLEAGARALRDELGASSTLTEIGTLCYKAHDSEKGLTEFEYDHILMTKDIRFVDPNPNEVAAVEWLTPAEIARRFQDRPSDFAPWLPRILCSISEMRTSEQGMSDLAKSFGFYEPDSSPGILRRVRIPR
jgi:isopentenyl-diphosphate Delta-isomerase